MSHVTSLKNKRNNTDSCRFNFSMFGLLLLVFSLVNIATADEVTLSEEVTLIETVPDARALADLLYPVEVRSIVLSDNSQSHIKKPKSILAMLINFEFDKAVITKSSLPFLDAVGEMLTLPDMENARLIIEGHTDSAGIASYNKNLSERRALAVRQYLVSRFKIDQARLHPVGMGETQLLDKKNSKAAINRRVQFKPL